MQVCKRHVHANRLAGIDNEWLTPGRGQGLLPDPQHRPRRPLSDRRRGLQRRGGTARHDAVAWGYARAASARGVDIIQNCEVTAIRRDASGAVSGVETTRGPIATKKLGVVAAGHTSVVMAMAGVRMPLESYPLQALVSEPVKPMFPCVVMSNTIHAYMSQSDKGELVIGAGTDAYTSYSQTGGLHIANHTLEAICELFPDRSPHAHAAQLGRHRRRHARPLADHRQDAGSGPVRQLRLGHRRLQGDAGLGPRVRRTRSPRGEPHPITAPFTLDRFRTGRLIDEAAAAAVAH